jgi:molybdenum cofactor cytidylyltransferase
VIFAELPLTEAEGAILAHSLVIDGVRWPKGRQLGSDDIARAAAAGFERLTVARLETGDVPEDAAAAALAATLAGVGLVAMPAAHGRANIAAAAEGIVRLDPAIVAAINSIDEALTLATLAADARVAAGEIVATIKIIRYAVAAEMLAEAIAVARPMALAAFRPHRIALMQTRLDGTANKMLARTEQVTRARVEALGCEFIALPPCRHDIAALAERLGAPLDADILLIAGASATVDRGDVVPAAIVAAGGRVERLGMPVDPGNLLCLAWLNDAPVIGMPGCARSPKRNGFDIVLERLVAGVAVNAADIAAMGAGGLLPEAERPQPRAVAPPPPLPGSVGAIILAAGRSSRMGGPHKLLETWAGKPIIAHVADAISAAGLPPPIVVTGARGDDVRAALAGRAAVFVAAADYAEGLSRSLRTGVAAVPAEWGAALVCLGDMPRVEPAVLAALAAAPGHIVVPRWAGRRGNPVRWSRQHFAGLMALAGDVGGKALLAEFADDVTEIDAISDAVLDDIDTPAALAALRTRALP